jgi:hypothetical protein
MGQPPLNISEELKEIREWITSYRFTKLADISSWDALGSWRSWVFPGTPDHFQTQKNILLAALMGLAPVHLHLTEKWGWGKSSSYTTAQGFTFLQYP